MQAFRRYRLGVFVVLLAALTLLSTIQVSALPPNTPINQVRIFFGGYLVAAKAHPPNTAQMKRLRQQYITPQANAQLDQWAATHHADPIFRSQNIPRSGSVQQGDS
ncbi:MAG: hypothetical protein ACREN8_13495, partial [Candidatus Dormibacteraceae bacterium]